MKRIRSWAAAGVAFAITAAVLTGCSSTPSETPESGAAPEGDPIHVGIIATTSGPLGVYGESYLDGLKAGLDYATDGTGVVGGHEVIFEIVDDGGDPTKAITQATDMVGKGISIIAGTGSSGVAVQMAPFAEENDILYIVGSAATDAVTGINQNTFRAGRQTFQDVATAAQLLGDLGPDSEVLVFAQDSAFGQGNAAAVGAVLGANGAQVSSVLVPNTATEFTPYAKQVLDAAPDLVFVAWAGDTAAAMWQSLGQQGVLDKLMVTTGLGDPTSYGMFDNVDPTEIKFLSHFVPGEVSNEPGDALAKSVDHVELFTPDGFVTAQLIVRALSEADSTDVAGMITALEGWKFEAPKGAQQVRASDHAMLQPMFTAALEGTSGAYSAKVMEIIPSDAVAPPEKK